MVLGDTFLVPLDFRNLHLGAIHKEFSQNSNSERLMPLYFLATPLNKHSWQEKKKGFLEEETMRGYRGQRLSLFRHQKDDPKSLRNGS